MNICSEAVIDSIRQGVSNIPPESGGLLGGRNDVVTNICLDKGILGKHPCSYTPDTRFLNQKINQWAETGIQFMGMFHVHFGGTESLSEGDKEYIVRIMEVMPKKIGCLYFPVVVMPERKVVAYKAVRNNEKVVIKRDCIKCQGGTEHEEREKQENDGCCSAGGMLLRKLQRLRLC